MKLTEGEDRAIRAWVKSRYALSMTHPGAAYRPAVELDEEAAAKQMFDVFMLRLTRHGKDRKQVPDE